MASSTLRFGPFELDPSTGELRKGGRRLRFPPQPARVLGLLAGRPGELVSRDEIRSDLWPRETFVDFELGINHCLKRIRAALGDRAASPRFIETLPKRGYRFIAPVERLGAPDVPTVAVLPFENLNHDPALDFFADGVTDAIITELARLKALRVISRQSVLRLKGTQRTLGDIAHELGVVGLVEGSALHAGAHARITAQLVLVHPERHVWANSYECDMGEILAAERRVAREVAHGVEATLAPSERAVLDSVAPVHPEAHEAYLKARHHGDAWSREGFEKSLHYLHYALTFDPDYAPAHAELAWTLSRLGYWGHVPVEDAFPAAREAAARALALDAGLSSAHQALGWVKWLYERDLAGAERMMRCAIARGPSDADAHMLLAVFLATVRARRTEAVEEGRAALRLDPISQSTNFSMAWLYLFVDEYRQATEQARRTLELYPGSLQANYVLGLSAVAQDNDTEAVAALEAACAMSRDAISVGYLAHAHGRFGRRDRAAQLIAELLASRGGGHVAPKAMIVAYAGIGENDHAFQWLERAYDERDGILYWLKAAPVFDPLRADPRFDDLAHRLELS
jgi:TolB-like protein/tetratricopeptide (TPR) repeat protein